MIKQLIATASAAGPWPWQTAPGRSALSQRVLLRRGLQLFFGKPPAAYGNARPPHPARRWQADGTLARPMEAGAPVIERMRAGYWGLIRDASLDWRNSYEFIGKGIVPRQPYLGPRGRYADRRRP